MSPTLQNPAGGHRTTEVNQPLVVGTLQAHGKGRGYRVDTEGAADGHLVPVGFHMIQDPIHPEGGSPALGRKSNGMGVGTAVGVRRLTPVECERLQGWPDDWTAPPGLSAPDSRRYAAIGDGVTANVSHWLGIRLLKYGGSG